MKFGRIQVGFAFRGRHGNEAIAANGVYGSVAVYAVYELALRRCTQHCDDLLGASPKIWRQRIKSLSSRSVMVSTKACANVEAGDSGACFFDRFR